MTAQLVLAKQNRLLKTDARRINSGEASSYAWLAMPNQRLVRLLLQLQPLWGASTAVLQLQQLARLKQLLSKAASMLETSRCSSRTPRAASYWHEWHGSRCLTEVCGA